LKGYLNTIFKNSADTETKDILMASSYFLSR